MQNKRPSSRQDHVVANENRSAIRIGDAHLRKSNAIAEENFAEYLAVQGDAADLARDLNREQRRRWIRSVSLRATAVVGTGAALALAVTAYRQETMNGSSLGLIGILVVVGLLAVLTTLPGRIRAQGVEITDTVFEHLTPHDRDVLFRAHAMGPGVCGETLQMLMSRYASESKQDQDRTVSSDRASARALFESSLFDPDSDPN